MAMTAKRKENSADFSPLIPCKRPADMVVPEREIPGRMANACAVPMSSEFVGERVAVLRLLNLVEKRINPVTRSIPQAK